jgi:deoxyribonuclease-4
VALADPDALNHRHEDRVRDLPGPPLGAHMSIAGGFARAVDRAAAVGATALQIFVKSARQWDAAPLAREDTFAFRKAVEAAGLGRHLLAHAGYLINLASPHPELWRRSLAALESEVDRCADLGVPHLIVHPGSHGGSGTEAGLTRLARGLERVFRPTARRAPGRRTVRVLLEITAGQGRSLGARFEELGWVLDHGAHPERLGVCFDTCHVFAAGYEFRDRRSYRATFEALDRAVGLTRVHAFHLNDSVHGLGSRRDRHQHIGRGEVGLEAFRLVLNDRRFRDRPMVLETPKGEDLAADAVNLGVLRAMIGRRPPRRAT